MKKSLVALAALAVVGIASAQSSVTLYGVADMAVGKTNRAGLNLVNDQFQAITSSTLNNGTSRFGLRGTEDLGGGLKAGFNFEAGLSLAGGATDTSTFQRAANISLMGGFGEIRAGRSLTTSFYSVTSWELTGAANYSVVNSQFGFGGAAPRASGQVMYNSPSFGGFKLSASTVLKGNEVYGNPGDGKAKYDVAATYAAGPIVASVAYNTVQDISKAYVLGGKYNFGAFQVAGSLNKAETDAGVVLGKGVTLGASANVGPVVLTFDVARDTAFDDTDMVLEAKYALSKRTFAYGVVMRNGDDNVGTQSVTGYAVGVRHNF